MSPPSKLEFASLAAYCPRGGGDEHKEHKRSREFMRKLKENRVAVQGLTAAQFAVKRLVEERPAFVDDFFASGRCLIPMPRSSLQKRGGLWPGLEIASAIVAQLPGLTVTQHLRRASSVPKASISAERPSFEDHRASLELITPCLIPAEVTLVDDVITSGAQAMGAALAIWDVQPDVVIRVFAVIRTISDETAFSKILEPVRGSIESHGERTRRRP